MAESTLFSIENKDFFTKSCHRQTYQNYEQPLQRMQNSDFQSPFSESKINGIFQMNEILAFESTLCLKICPILGGSVHNFGWSDDNMIS